MLQTNLHHIVSSSEKIDTHKTHQEDAQRQKDTPPLSTTPSNNHSTLHTTLFKRIQHLIRHGVRTTIDGARKRFEINILHDIFYFQYTSIFDIQTLKYRQNQLFTTKRVGVREMG